MALRPLQEAQKATIPTDVDSMAVVRPAGAALVEPITSPLSGFPSQVELAPDDNNFATFEILGWAGRWRHHALGYFGPWLSFDGFTKSTPGVGEKAIRRFDAAGKPIMIPGPDGRPQQSTKLVLDPGGWADRLILAGVFRVDDLSHPDGTQVGMPPIEIRRTVQMYDWAEDRLCHAETLAQLVDRMVRLNRTGIPRAPSPAWLKTIGRLEAGKEITPEMRDQAERLLRDAQGRWRTEMLGAIDIAVSRGFGLPEDRPIAGPLETARQVYAQVFGRPTFSDNVEWILEAVETRRAATAKAVAPIKPESAPRVTPTVVEPAPVKAESIAPFVPVEPDKDDAAVIDPAPEAPKPAPDYDAMSIADLRALVTERNISVPKLARGPMIEALKGADLNQ